MNLADVMDALAEAAKTVVDRSYGYPTPTISPPTVIVGHPGEVEFDRAYVRGQDQITLPVIAVAGRTGDRQAHLQLCSWLAGSGATSLKAALEAPDWNADGLVVHVPRVEISAYTVGGVDFLAAVFDVEVTGVGA